MSDLNDPRDQYRRSLEAFIRGDPEPQKLLWSRRDDITLAYPLGPPAKGYDRVCEVADIAAAQVRDGEGLTLETISFVEGFKSPIEVSDLSTLIPGLGLGSRGR